MQSDKIRWNARYKTETFSSKPASAVERFVALAAKGRALDIACGLGRHSLFLAKQGFLVDSVDISDVALENLRGRENIHVIETDLDHFYINPKTYELIVNINFLDRRLIPHIKGGLKNGGVVIFETFVESEPNPQRRDYLLSPGELPHLFWDLHILYYEERKIQKPSGEEAEVATFVGRKENNII